MIPSLVLCLAAQSFTVPEPGSAVRRAVLDSLRAKTRAELRGVKVVFQVDHLRRSGDWVFFKGKGLNADGSAIDYSKTTFAAEVKEGMFDDWVCALFHRSKGKWTVKAYAWGATDVPYVEWWKKYGAPKEIFDFSEGG
jgi:hypothetical protein